VTLVQRLCRRHEGRLDGKQIARFGRTFPSAKAAFSLPTRVSVTRSPGQTITIAHTNTSTAEFSRSPSLQPVRLE